MNHYIEAKGHLCDWKVPYCEGRVRGGDLVTIHIPDVTCQDCLDKLVASITRRKSV